MVTQIARRLPEGLDLTVITNTYTVVSVLIEKPKVPHTTERQIMKKFRITVSDTGISQIKNSKNLL